MCMPSSVHWSQPAVHPPKSRAHCGSRIAREAPLVATAVKPATHYLGPLSRLRRYCHQQICTGGRPPGMGLKKCATTGRWLK